MSNHLGKGLTFPNNRLVKPLVIIQDPKYGKAPEYVKQ